MRLYKKNLNLLCITRWTDAQTHITTSLEEVLKTPFGKKETYGRLAYYDTKMVVIRTELDSDDNRGDFTVIPIDWVDEVSFIE